MNMNDHERPRWRTRIGVVLCGFLLIATFYLFTEHTTHVFGVPPYLLILACPLMHLFMHQRAWWESPRRVGRRDRALISVMTHASERASAVPSMRMVPLMRQIFPLPLRGGRHGVLTAQALNRHNA
jgi:hypothetical protein